MTSRPRALCLFAAVLASCARSTEEPSAIEADAGAVTLAPSASIGPPSRSPAPRQGMVWIPGGALVAGTPPDLLPRKVDEEMRGEQVILQGFYIDLYPYPNEEGAIPLTNVTHAEATTLCKERGKRLCTELEWERACKGPENRVYEYGDKHRPDRCGTGVMPSLRPSGLRVGCRSDFGVRDLHGGAFEWTSSRWERGTRGETYTVRGGNGTAGEIVGRCANGEGKPADTKSGSIGLRCCAGEPNPAEVVLQVRRAQNPLERSESSKAAARRLLELLPDEVRKALTKSGTPRVDRTWAWRPVANEELVAASVCAGLGVRPTCGVLVARETLGRVEFVAWAPSGHMQATLHIDYRDARDVWLLGGDEQGRYKRLIAYAWGRVTVHGEERRVGTPEPKTKKKKRASAAP